MTGWQVGARAVIVISEHAGNANRVVALEETAWTDSKGAVQWIVFDDMMFNGYDCNMRDVPMSDRVYRASKLLCIQQWKLRLLEENEAVHTVDGVQYVDA